MSNNTTIRILGISIVLLAILIAVIPQFTSCYAQGKQITLANGNQIPMKCLWTARAELVAALPLFAVGLMLAISKNRGMQRYLFPIGGLIGILVLALPTTLIGVCSSDMPCNLIMKPAMLGLGSLTFLVNVVGLVVAGKTSREAFEKSTRLALR